MNINDFKTPGQYLKALLDAREWSQRVLAIILEIDESLLNKIVNNNRNIDARTALLLGEVFEVDPEDFLSLQKKYDLEKAKIESRPDAGRAKRARIFGDLPISNMIKRGWIRAENVRDVPQVESALAYFFGVDSIDSIEILPHAAKKTQTNTAVTPAQLAWLYRVKAIASDMLAGKFSPQSAKNTVEQLKNLLHAPEEIRKVPRILAENGIRFLIVEALPSSKIDGACLWIDEKHPVIAMTLRYDRIDNFWFVLRHELEHVINRDGLKTIMLDYELEGEKAGDFSHIAEEERMANKAAIEFCIPQKKLDSFIARKSPFFKETDILGFANTINVHPGLIAGQLQHRTGRYDRFRSHLVKIKHIISKSALIDGWGDVAPLD